MNLTPDDSASLVDEVNAVVGVQTTVQVCVCPPFTSLPIVSEKVEQSEVLLGAQNMHEQPSGAYTGEISAEMLRSLYVSHVILGHSERRQYCGETNASINGKILAAIQANLKPIYCIGETLDEREAGKTMEVLSAQVRGGLENYPSHALEFLVIAYEPVWAIGTGKTATDEMAQGSTCGNPPGTIGNVWRICRIFHTYSLRWFDEAGKCGRSALPTRCGWGLDWWSLALRQTILRYRGSGHRR